MESIEYSNALYQISVILKYLSPNLRTRIPKRIISYIEYNKSKSYNWKLNKALPLTNQDLLPMTKEILTGLYKEYICDYESKMKLDEILKNNQEKYEYIQRIKFNPDNLFKK